MRKCCIKKHESTNRLTRGWYLYIVRCCDGTLYTGITNDVERRIAQHNNGKASKYTRARTPVGLVYKEGCREKSSALRKVLRIKSLSRKEKEEYILGNGAGARRKGRKEKRY